MKTVLYNLKIPSCFYLLTLQLTTLWEFLLWKKIAELYILMYVNRGIQFIDRMQFSCVSLLGRTCCLWKESLKKRTMWKACCIHLPTTGVKGGLNNRMVATLLHKDSTQISTRFLGKEQKNLLRSQRWQGRDSPTNSDYLLQLFSFFLRLIKGVYGNTEQADFKIILKRLHFAINNV